MIKATVSHIKFSGGKERRKNDSTALHVPNKRMNSERHAMPDQRPVARWQLSANQFAAAAVSEEEVRLFYFYKKKKTPVEVESDKFIITQGLAGGRIHLKCITWWWGCWADCPSPLKAFSGFKWRPMVLLSLKERKAARLRASWEFHHNSFMHSSHRFSLVTQVCSKILNWNK